MKNRVSLIESSNQHQQREIDEQFIREEVGKIKRQYNHSRDYDIEKRQRESLGKEGSIQYIKERHSTPSQYSSVKVGRSGGGDLRPTTS